MASAAATAATTTAAAGLRPLLQQLQQRGDVQQLRREPAATAATVRSPEQPGLCQRVHASVELSGVELLAASSTTSATSTTTAATTTATRPSSATTTSVSIDASAPGSSAHERCHKPRRQCRSSSAACRQEVRRLPANIRLRSAVPKLDLAAVKKEHAFDLFCSTKKKFESEQCPKKVRLSVLMKWITFEKIESRFIFGGK